MVFGAHMLGLPYMTILEAISSSISKSQLVVGVVDPTFDVVDVMKPSFRIRELIVSLVSLI